MSLSESLGAFQFLRMKASWYVETARAWVMPGAAAGAFTKFLGFEVWQAILAALLIAPIVEGTGYLLGRFMWEHGGTEKEYEMAIQRDRFRRESLGRFEAIEKLLHQVAASLGRPCWERDPAKGNDWAESARRNPRPDER